MTTLPHHDEQKVSQIPPLRQGYTRFDFRCHACSFMQLNVYGKVGQRPQLLCQQCGQPMSRYYGSTHDLLVNYGERSTHDDIERFRFQNL